MPRLESRDDTAETSRMGQASQMCYALQPLFRTAMMTSTSKVANRLPPSQLELGSTATSYSSILPPSQLELSGKTMARMGQASARRNPMRSSLHDRFQADVMPSPFRVARWPSSKFDWKGNATLGSPLGLASKPSTRSTVSGSANETVLIISAATELLTSVSKALQVSQAPMHETLLPTLNALCYSAAYEPLNSAIPLSDPFCCFVADHRFCGSILLLHCRPPLLRIHFAASLQATAFADPFAASLQATASADPYCCFIAGHHCFGSICCFIAGHRSCGPISLLLSRPPLLRITSLLHCRLPLLRIHFAATLQTTAIADPTYSDSLCPRLSINHRCCGPTYSESLCARLSITHRCCGPTYSESPCARLSIKPTAVADQTHRCCGSNPPQALAPRLRVRAVRVPIASQHPETTTALSLTKTPFTHRDWVPPHMFFTASFLAHILPGCGPREG